MDAHFVHAPAASVTEAPMFKLNTRLMVLFLLIIGGCATSPETAERDSDDGRNISHDEAVEGMLDWIDSADPYEEALKLTQSSRLGVLCFKGQENACPGEVPGVTKEMLMGKGFQPIYIWGFDKEIEDEQELDKIWQYMTDFNEHVLNIVFKEQLNNKERN